MNSQKAYNSWILISCATIFFFWIENKIMFKIEFIRFLSTSFLIYFAINYTRVGYKNLINSFSYSLSIWSLNTYDRETHFSIDSFLKSRRFSYSYISNFIIFDLFFSKICDVWEFLILYLYDSLLVSIMINGFFCYINFLNYYKKLRFYSLL